MKVPKPTNMGVGMSNLPGVRFGGHADADAFGAGRARQMQDLARSGLFAGNSMLDEAQRRQQRDDNAILDNVIADANKRRNDQRQGIYDQFKDGEIVDQLPKEIDKKMAELRKEMEGRLQNDMQRERFAHAFHGMAIQESQNAFQYRDQRKKEYEILGKQKIISGIGEELRSKITSVNGYAGVLDGPQFDMIAAKTRELNEHLPPEGIELEVKKAIRAQHQDNLKAAANISPQLALQYLNEEKVKEAFAESDWMALRNEYKKLDDNREAISVGMEWGRQGLKGTALIEAAYEKFKDDPEKMDTAIKRAQLYNTEREQENLDANKDLLDSTLKEMAPNGYKASDIPEDIAKNNPEVYKSLLAYCDYIDKVGAENVVPDIRVYEWLMKRDPEVLRSLFQDPAYMIKMRFRLGDGVWWQDVENRARGVGVKSKGATTEQAKTFGLSDVKSADLTDYALKMYIDKEYRTTGKYPDDSQDAEKVRQGQYLMRVREALAMAMNEKGAELLPHETSNVIGSLLQGFKYDEKGMMYNPRKDAYAFEVASNPEKHQDVLKTENGKTVRGAHGGEVHIDTTQGVEFESINSGSLDLPDTVRGPLLVAEKHGGQGRFYPGKDGEKGVYTIVTGNKVDVIDMENNTREVIEATPRQDEAPRRRRTSADWPESLRKLKEEHGIDMMTKWNDTIKLWIVNLPSGLIYINENGHTVPPPEYWTDNNPGTQEEMEMTPYAGEISFDLEPGLTDLGDVWAAGQGLPPSPRKK